MLSKIYISSERVSTTFEILDINPKAKTFANVIFLFLGIPDLISGSPVLSLGISIRYTQRNEKD